MKKSTKTTTLFKSYFKFFAILFFLIISFISITVMLFLEDYWEYQRLLDLLTTAKSLSVTMEYMNEAEQEDEIAALFDDIAETLDDSVEVFYTSSLVGATEVIYSSTVYDNNGNNVSFVTKGDYIPGEFVLSILYSDYYMDVTDFNDMFDSDMFVTAVAFNDSSGDPAGIVFVVQPVSEGITPYFSYFIKIYLIVIIFALIIVYLSITIAASNITRYLRQISEASKQLADGNFGYRVNLKQTKKKVKEITELQNNFNQMASNLEAIEKSRSSFISNVSHDLKTPITTISGFIDGILDGTISEDKREYYLKIVSNETKRLSRLVVSMLNLSKIETGSYNLAFTKVDITKLITIIFINFEQKINEKELNIEGLERLDKCMIDADYDLINQVFYNLIDNAVKFSDFGGTISIYYEIGDETVKVFLKNTGPGISKEDIPHVFDRFYKSDRSRNMDNNSAGLGLSITKTIVNLHSGKIEVASETNNYTVFTLTLKKIISKQ